MKLLMAAALLVAPMFADCCSYERVRVQAMREARRSRTEMTREMRRVRTEARRAAREAYRNNYRNRRWFFGLSPAAVPR